MLWHDFPLQKPAGKVFAFFLFQQILLPPTFVTTIRLQHCLIVLDNKEQFYNVRCSTKFTLQKTSGDINAKFYRGRITVSSVQMKTNSQQTS